MGNFGNTLLGVEISEDSVTWGEKENIFVGRHCFPLPKHGFYKRPNEQSVLPHAIGCQLPTPVYAYCESCGALQYRSDYKSVLQGDRMIIEISV